VRRTLSLLPGGGHSRTGAPIAEGLTIQPSVEPPLRSAVELSATTGRRCSRR
jgi:hypothetical protein